MSNSNKKSTRDPNFFIAVGVTIISLCALVVSVKQTQLMTEEGELIREYSRASVWPSLELGVAKGHNTEDGSLSMFRLNVSNNGVGPAIITDVKVAFEDSVATDWWHYFDLIGVPDSIETYITNRGVNSTIIPAGETLEILNLDDNLPLANQFYMKAQGLEIDIYYESIYHQAWKHNGSETVELKDFIGLDDNDQFDG